MNPTEIALVRSSWMAARTSNGAFTSLVEAALTGHEPALGEHERERRLMWMISAIDALMPFLDRPTSFVSSSRELIQTRMPVTLAELAVDRDSLVLGLQQFAGEFDQPTEHAWRSATDLFGEIIGDLVLQPFQGNEP
jgi:hypothetical protein